MFPEDLLSQGSPWLPPELMALLPRANRHLAPPPLPCPLLASSPAHSHFQLPFSLQPGTSPRLSSSFSTWAPTTFFLPRIISWPSISLRVEVWYHQGSPKSNWLGQDCRWSQPCPLQIGERQTSLHTVRDEPQDLCLFWPVVSFGGRTFHQKAPAQLLKALLLLCSSERLLFLSGLSVLSAVPCWVGTHAFAGVLSVHLYVRGYAGHCHPPSNDACTPL